LFFRLKQKELATNTYAVLVDDHVNFHWNQDTLGSERRVLNTIPIAVSVTCSVWILFVLKFQAENR
jgi:hypothetical protein